MHIWEMARLAHDNAQLHGFWDGDMVNETNIVRLSGPRFSECLMLIVSEAAEALEDYRQNGLEGEWLRVREDGKPEGIASELADIIIRVGDLSQALGIDIDQVVADKMKYNATRPFRHGGKRA